MAVKCMALRAESDSIGSKEVPAAAYFGVQSLRAKENFPITGRRLRDGFICNLARIKKAAALANEAAGALDLRRAQAIAAACDEILEGKLHEQFIVDPIQGGAGTSANMNANEVIANRAIELLGGEKGDYAIVHPNDHVNMAQSTNDVFPSAGKLTALDLLTPVLHELARLQKALAAKAKEFADVVKIGRTQLQDAVPQTMGQTFAVWARMLGRDCQRLHAAREELYTLNLGGTATGTGINTTALYRGGVVPLLSQLSTYPLRQAEDLMDATQNLDGFVAVSGALKTCAVDLSKMCNDLRLLSSGPRAGLGELSLPAMQNGSSIMPGKVNPVIPEVVTQVCFAVIGNDATITMAAEAGQMELNAFEPVLFDRLFDSLESLAHAVSTLTDNCVQGIRANRERCRALLEAGTGTATALCPYIGYKNAASLAKESLRTGVPIKELARQKTDLTDEQLARILDPMTLTRPQPAAVSFLTALYESAQATQA